LALLVLMKNSSWFFYKSKNRKKCELLLSLSHVCQWLRSEFRNEERMSLASPFQFFRFAVLSAPTTTMSSCREGERKVGREEQCFAAIRVK
jgi:hypothetical protein